ncbi:MAG: hypothetical protein DRZ82_06910 [Thermoprotei archaeon]|nr:MAG: hypothetical protein DRZ82_06910 [Thermoprotei archaeon]
MNKGNGIIYRVYREGDEEGITEVMRKCFGTFNQFQLDAKTWLSYREVDYGFKTDYSLVAEANGKIVGHVQVVLRRLKLGKGYVNVGGIANVSTDPDYRGRGIATNLMRMALELCKKEGIHLSDLMTSYGYVAHRVYRRLGYADVIFFQRFLGEREEVEETIKTFEKEVNVKVRDYKDDDLPHLERIYNSFAEEYSGIAWRDTEYWRKKIVGKKRFYHMWFYDEEGMEILVAERGGEVSGYSYFALGPKCKRLVMGSSEVGILLELVAKDMASLKGLLVETLRRMLEVNVKTFDLVLPPYEPYRSLLRRFHFFIERGIYMSNIVDLEGLMREYIPTFEYFMRRAGGFNVRIGLRSSYGNVNLELKGDTIEVTKERPDVVFQISYHSLARMVHFVENVYSAFFKGHIDIVKTNSSITASRALQCLSTLFPKMKFFVWQADHW